MQISDAGMSLIKKFEGLSLKAYQDVVGLWTIGYGHLIKRGESYETIDEAGAEALLKQDVQVFERHVSQVVKVALNQNQFDALICFSFNIGCGNLQKSTLLKYLNAGNYQLAAKEFLKWDKARGKKVRGLTLRRQQEHQLFLQNEAIN